MACSSSVPPHIQPPMAQVPKAIGETSSSVPGIRMYSINASFQFIPVDGGANDADDLLLIQAIEVGPSQADDGNFLSGAAHRAVRDLASFLSNPNMGYQPGYPGHRYGCTKGRQCMEKMAPVHFSILSKRDLCE